MESLLPTATNHRKVLVAQAVFLVAVLVAEVDVSIIMRGIPCRHYHIPFGIAPWLQE